MWPVDTKGQERKPSQLAIKLNKATWRMKLHSQNMILQQRCDCLTHYLRVLQALLKPLVGRAAQLSQLGSVPVLHELLDAVLYKWDGAP